jgi:imidazolonepropionase-like amidohydrolase
VVIDSPDHAIHEIRGQVKDGVDLIKFAMDGTLTAYPKGLVAAFTEEETRRMVAEVHRLGKRGACHARGAEATLYSARAGMDIIFHASRVTVCDRGTAKRDVSIDAPLLVDDDLGRESGDWASDQVLSLILDRHDNGRKTIITTNLRRSSKVVTPEQAAQYRNQFMDLRYTDSLMSRLSDPTATRFVVCKGDDIRPTHTQESAE